MTYPLLAQKDGRWRHLSLGYGGKHSDGSPITIGSDGCVITCLAMMTDCTPQEVNQKLLQHKQFAGCKVLINAIQYARVFDGRITHKRRSRWYEDAVPEQDMEALRTRLNSGDAAIVCLDARPDMKGMQYHYALAVGTANDGEIVVNDPWYAVTDRLNQINRVWWKRLLRGIYGKTSAEAIYRYDLFGRNG